MQILKNNVRIQIERAAMQLFAARGYDCTTIAEIAALAGISTGNVYRYHSNKEELLYALIPETFVESCLKTLKKKVGLVRGMSANEIAASDHFNLANKKFIEFLLTHRQKILVLMRGCSNTKWADFRQTIRRTVIDNVSDYFSSLEDRHASQFPVPDLLLLVSIYDNLINSTIAILGAETGKNDCRKVLQGLLSYHLSGMTAFC